MWLAARIIRNNIHAFSFIITLSFNYYLMLLKNSILSSDRLLLKESCLNFVYIELCIFTYIYFSNNLYYCAITHFICNNCLRESIINKYFKTYFSITCNPTARVLGVYNLRLYILCLVNNYLARISWNCPTFMRIVEQNIKTGHVLTSVNFYH